MPNVPVYNQQGERTGELELDPAVFGVRVNPSVLHQVVVAHAANARSPIANTKTRGEVRGGGKKPWAQKHTGRARHGSIRSPLWVGGGTTFGPRSERGYAQKVNVKVRRAALRMALSDKVASNRFIVLDDFTPEGGKTRAAKRVLEAAVAQAHMEKRVPSVLLVLPAERRATARSIENIPRVVGIDATHLNTFDVLRYDVCVVTKSAVERAAAQLRPRRTNARVDAKTSPSAISNMRVHS
ncbi:MAG: 50S ribosomal protein L4 [bacterium]|nr:50S ribosomal protein L4 [bacterium]